jgi:hypothetical protein
MSKNLQLLMRSVVSLALLVFVVGCNAAVAQTEVTGNWTGSLGREKSASTRRQKSDDAEAIADEQMADLEVKGDRIYLDFERPTTNGHRSKTGHTFLFSELQGLTREQVERGGAVNFSLVREAGTISCEGIFQNGKGVGTFRFTGSQSFVTAMKSRGFDFEKNSRTWNDERDSENKLFSAAVINVTTALADDLLTAGLGKIDIDDLFKAAIFKVTPAYIAAVRSEGIANPSVEELVKMKIFKIDSDFIRKAKAEGVPLEVERLVERRIGAHRN